MSVHREGVNPSSMDGVPDLRDHNSIKSGLFIAFLCAPVKGMVLWRRGHFYKLALLGGEFFGRNVCTV